MKRQEVLGWICYESSLAPASMAANKITDRVISLLTEARTDGAVNELGVTLKNFDKIRKSYKGFAEYADARIAQLTNPKQDDV